MLQLTLTMWPARKPATQSVSHSPAMTNRQAPRSLFLVRPLVPWALEKLVVRVGVHHRELSDLGAGPPLAWRQYQALMESPYNLLEVGLVGQCGIERLHVRNYVLHCLQPVGPFVLPRKIFALHLLHPVGWHRFEPIPTPGDRESRIVAASSGRTMTHGAALTSWA